MNTVVEPEPVPKLGLAELDRAEIPHLEVIAFNAKDDIIANVAAQIVALIVSPLQNRILYGEFACTSDSGAHALMGSASDPRGTVEFRFSRVGDGEYVEIQPPESPRIANVRLAVPGYSRHLHHVAMFDRSGELMLAPDDETLWRKLREKMTCPTLEQWGTVVMNEVYRSGSGALLECEAFGVPEGLRAFVLGKNAQEVFDGIISEYVCSNGLPRRGAA
jgi:hypothetical protein